MMVNAENAVQILIAKLNNYQILKLKELKIKNKIFAKRWKKIKTAKKLKINVIKGSIGIKNKENEINV